MPTVTWYALALVAGLLIGLATAYFGFKGKKAEVEASQESKLRDELWREVAALRGTVEKQAAQFAALQEKYIELKTEYGELAIKYEELKTKGRCEECGRKISEDS